MTHEAREDADLVIAVRAGDRAAWQSLARRHAPRLAAYLGARLRRPAVVDALVAEAIVSGIRHLPELADPAGFAAWFRRLGAGIAMKWARDNPGEPLDEAFPVGRVPEEHAGSLAELAAFEHEISRLDEQQRMALELRWRGGMAAEDIAAAMRTTVAEAERLADRAEAILAGGSDGG